MYRRRRWHPTPVLLPGKSHGRRSLVGSWRVRRDWATSLSLSLSCIGEGNGKCLENAKDGGAWWAAVYGVTQSRTRLKWLSSSIHMYAYTHMYIFVLFRCSVMSDCLWLQHTRLPCASPAPRACSHSCPSSRWCHPAISSSVVPFSSCPQSFPASGSFPMSWLFTSGGQSTGASASASVLPVNIQYWFPLGLTGLISLQYLYILEKMYFLEKMSRML